MYAGSEPGEITREFIFLTFPQNARKTGSSARQWSERDPESLRNIYRSWRVFSEQLRIPSEPWQWSCIDLAIWIKWIGKEFSENTNELTQKLKVNF